MFRHGGTVQADRCEDMGRAVGYLRFGGWVVIPKALLASVEDERGLTRLNPPWTPEEQRDRIQAVPKEGGVPVGPTTSEAPPPPPAAAPTVVYVPVPTPVEPQPVYQVEASPYVFPGVFFCPNCFRHRLITPHRPSARVVPTSPTNIGPQAIQKTFLPISPIR